MNGLRMRILVAVAVVGSIVSDPVPLMADESACVEVSIRAVGEEWREMGTVTCSELERRGRALTTTVSTQGEDHHVRARLRARPRQDVSVLVDQSLSEQGPGSGTFWTTTSSKPRFDPTPGYTSWWTISLERKSGETVEMELFVRRFSYEAGPDQPETYFIPVADIRVRYL